MTLEEYFGDWLKVIDRNELSKMVKQINLLYKNKQCEPEYNNIFKVFNITPYNKLCQIWLGQDPYFQKGVATGIAFGNKKDVKNVLPSLNILKEGMINLEVPHNFITFDQTLESLSKQGILLLNSALTVEVNKPGSHIDIWRPFIISFLKKLSSNNPGLIYILWGNQAKSFKDYIYSSEIITMNHPSYFARTHTKIPYDFFYWLNTLNYNKFDRKIEYYKEFN